MKSSKARLWRNVCTVYWDVNLGLEASYIKTRDSSSFIYRPQTLRQFKVFQNNCHKHSYVELKTFLLNNGKMTSRETEGNLNTHKTQTEKTNLQFVDSVSEWNCKPAARWPDTGWTGPQFHLQSLIWDKETNLRQAKSGLIWMFKFWRWNWSRVRERKNFMTSQLTDDSIITSSFPVNFLHKSAQAYRVQAINMLLLFPLLVGLFRFESQSEAKLDALCFCNKSIAFCCYKLLMAWIIQPKNYSK